MEKLEIIVKSNDAEIKFNNVSTLVIGNYTMTPDIITDIKVMGEYKFSEDIVNLMDKTLLESYNLEEDMNSDDILDRLRCLATIRDCLKCIERGYNTTEDKKVF